MQIGYYKKSGADNLISLLQGVDVGAQRYAQGKRYNDEQAQQQQQYDRRYGLGLAESARQDQAQKNANDASAREAGLYPDRQRAAKAGADYEEQRAKAATAQNEDQAAFDAHAKQQQDFADQVEIDSHRQEQAQAYKRLTGQDVPPEYWGTDSQGKKPGEMGWHWTMYDPKSPIPIKDQLNFNRQASEISTLPPGATREQRIAALKKQTQDSIVAQSKQAVLDEMGPHLQPKQEPGGKQQEVDPSQYVPEDTYKTMQKLAQDPSVSPDEMRKQWETVKKAHRDELAFGEARQMAVEGLDAFAQRIAQQQQDYGDLVGKVDPNAFETFRSLRHGIAESNLHGDTLKLAVQNAKDALTPGPKPKQKNDPTGFNAGDAFKMATAEAYDRNTPLGKAVAESPEKRDILIQMRTRDMLNQVHAVAGSEMPGSPGGAPLPSRQQIDPNAAVKAGWTTDEWDRYVDTGDMPKGKPIK